MATRRSFSPAVALRRAPVRLVDVVVAVAVGVGLFLVVRLGQAMTGRLEPGRTVATVSTAVGDLPYDAARSLLRMFVALAISVVFTFVYATAAARSRRAEKVLVPLLDVLQSVPILGFLSVTVTGFLALFPGSLFGLECAAIFAIFTSQAWNLTFSFYQSLVSQPGELDEMTRLFRLTRWQRFWRLDVPGSMIGLVWNAMMSFGGGWFFLAAAEAISVAGHEYALPGLGSYVAAAVAEGSLLHVLYAIVAMLVVILGVNFLFWQPLVAWAERFRMEETEAAERPRSAVLTVLRRSWLPRLAGPPARAVGRLLDRATRPFGLADRPLHPDAARRRVGNIVATVVVAAALAVGAWRTLAYIDGHVGLGVFPHAFWLGSLTFGRVVVLLAIASVIWTPIGVWIGMNPRVTRVTQPLVQLAASFPANFLFPFATVVFVKLGLSLDVGGILLMALGSQWYILFNVIAGASAIPSDLREAMTAFRLSRGQRWRRLILPAVFPAYVTGAITAAAGAWNASIVAEVVDFGRHHLVAHGLGAYITEATAHGTFAEVLVGVLVMSFFVVVVNRVVFRRLYRLAETRYAL